MPVVNDEEEFDLADDDAVCDGCGEPVDDCVCDEGIGEEDDPDPED